MKLSRETLEQALLGDVAAIRSKTRLLPAGGEGTKVSPPTYANGPYATEQRVVHREDSETKRSLVDRIPTVLLDSVQSQANRFEHALLRALREGKIQIPLIEVDFSKCNSSDPLEDLTDLVEINSLTVPHRIADAILRDSMAEEMIGERKQPVQFSKSSYNRWGNCRAHNATALFELCPTALIFGMWGSPKGAGLGARLSRAVASEIVGFEVQKGVKGGIRRDPLEIEVEGVPIYKARSDVEKETGFEWTTDEAKAERPANSPTLFGKDGKATEINHSNILAGTWDQEKQTFVNKERKEMPGGFTISYAQQTTVISLPALRRLNFPVPKRDEEDPKEYVKRQAAANEAARTVLAALALTAITWDQRVGYDLRSGCLLVPDAGHQFELVTTKTVEEKDRYTLDAEQAAALLTEAVEKATKLHLPWLAEPLRLTPSPNLVELVRKSRRKAAALPPAV